ncbi:hypothetical protein EDEG_01188 [Edhazardia aedis USNM 41457]|uniref:Uncharacterized protein n=1 Tax=Edhazardia aedis (strain USNM 41457) TaxID=1003232 RepID=J9DAU7_EDHAE|nr:hypothetical protein EDEG_01188 [Edhazardia aedis USNM 41457]|eukprot:EJW04604.1 hypothetical protein EDEG_01188 [Edhazardia aedis USNM 41457]
MFKNGIIIIFINVVLFLNSLKCSDISVEGESSRKLSDKYFKLQFLNKHEKKKENNKKENESESDNNKNSREIEYGQSSNLETVQKRIFNNKNETFVLRGYYNNEIIRVEHSELHRSQVVDFQCEYRSILNIIRGYRMASVSISGWNAYIKWSNNKTKVRFSDTDVTLEHIEKNVNKKIPDTSFNNRPVCNKFEYFDPNRISSIQTVDGKSYEIIYDDNELMIKMYYTSEDVVRKMHIVKIGLKNQSLEVITRKVRCKVLNDMYPYKTLINDELEIEAQKSIF